jgi:hypothetical protein
MYERSHIVEGANVMFALVRPTQSAVTYNHNDVMYRK